MEKILVIGAAGQLGIELVLALQAQHGVGNVDVSDIRVPDDEGVMRSRFLHTRLPISVYARPRDHASRADT